MKVFQLDDGEQWWYAAESKDQALRLHLEPIVGKVPEDLSTISEKVERDIGCKLEEIEIGELPDDRMLSVRCEDDNTVEVKSAAEWAAEGAGLIACTAY